MIVDNTVHKTMIENKFTDNSKFNPHQHLHQDSWPPRLAGRNPKEARDTPAPRKCSWVWLVVWNSKHFYAATYTPAWRGPVRHRRRRWVQWRPTTCAWATSPSRRSSRRSVGPWCHRCSARPSRTSQCSRPWAGPGRGNIVQIIVPFLVISTWNGSLKYLLSLLVLYGNLAKTEASNSLQNICAVIQDDFELPSMTPLHLFFSKMKKKTEHPMLAVPWPLVPLLLCVLLEDLLIQICSNLKRSLGKH